MCSRLLEPSTTILQMAPASRILDLANEIVRNTSIVNNHLAASGLDQPTFDVDGPTNLEFDSHEAEEARMNAIAASTELHDLLQGPIACLRPAVSSFSPHGQSKTPRLRENYDVFRSMPRASRLSTDITFQNAFPSTTTGSHSRTLQENAACTSQTFAVLSATRVFTIASSESQIQDSLFIQLHQRS